MRKLVFLVVAVSALATSCQRNSTSAAVDQERQRQEMEQRQNDEANIQKCAQMPQSILDSNKRDNNGPGVAISGTNHYSKTASKCFLDLSVSGFQEKQWFRQESLIDAYENKVLIGCATTREMPDAWCFVPGIATPDGKSRNLSTSDAVARIRTSMSN